MKTYIKSALDQIKAEDELIYKTEKSLRDILEKQKDEKTLFNKKRSVFPMKKIASAACAAILVGVLSIGGFKYYKTPVAYLSLDINPSVEIGVNAFNKVVSVAGYNADGKTILKGQDIVNSNVKEAVEELVRSASENGFIKNDGSTIISLTSETESSDVASTIEKDAEQGAKDAINSSSDTAVVYKDNIALARRDEARKLGITPGKLNLIQKLQALDFAATVDEYKDAKVTDIMKKIISLNPKKSSGNPDSDVQDIASAVEQCEKNTANKNSQIGKNNFQINSKKNKTDNDAVTSNSSDTNKNKAESNTTTNSSTTTNSIKSDNSNQKNSNKTEDNTTTNSSSATNSNNSNSNNQNVTNNSSLTKSKTTASDNGKQENTNNNKHENNK